MYMLIKSGNQLILMGTTLKNEVKQLVKTASNSPLLLAARLNFELRVVKSHAISRGCAKQKAQLIEL